MNIDDSSQARRVGLALSGGGSRAIAFHLGSMRALKDLGVLPSITTVSGVSGGAVIAALWADSAGDWETFETRTKELLTLGLTPRLIKDLFLSWRIVVWPAYFIVWVAFGLFLFFIKLFLSLVPAFLRHEDNWASKLLARVPSQIPREWSRTRGLERVLDSILAGKTLDELDQCGFELILNATELRSGTAFRFGNRVCACRGTSRDGEIRYEGAPSQFKVATAVAASAAYPLLLPPLDVRFQPRAGAPFWVSLTDGGVYDNLGISCLAPDRLPQFSAHTPTLDFVLCSSAAQGRKERESLVAGWPLRMIAVTLLQFRKLQEAGFQQLFAWKRSGQIKGFALAYLGQRSSSFDHAKAIRALNYPTNFSPMKQEDQELLFSMGYQFMERAVRDNCAELVASFHE